VNDPQEPNAHELVPPDLTEPPPQPPTQPSLEARPDILPPAHPPQVTPPHSPYEQGPYAPGPYTAPIPLPPKKNRAERLVLVLIVAVLLIGGGTAGYLAFDRSDEEVGAIAEAASETEATAAAPDADESSESNSELDSTFEVIAVPSLGAEMPVPSGNWRRVVGPGEEGDDLDDMSSYAIEYEPGWYANILVGRYNVTGMPFAPETMAATAIELTRFWTEESAANGVNGIMTEPVATEVTVDGHAGVLAEARASWDSTELSADKYERVITFLVDVDGTNAFYAQAWLPESADAEYAEVVEALQATLFAD